LLEDYSESNNKPELFLIVIPKPSQVIEVDCLPDEMTGSVKGEQGRRPHKISNSVVIVFELLNSYHDYECG
jgi:hypothetical protein